MRSRRHVSVSLNAMDYQSAFARSSIQWQMMKVRIILVVLRITLKLFAVVMISYSKMSRTNCVRCSLLWCDLSHSWQAKCFALRTSCSKYCSRAAGYGLVSQDRDEHMNKWEQSVVGRSAYLLLYCTTCRSPEFEKRLRQFLYASGHRTSQTWAGARDEASSHCQNLMMRQSSCSDRAM